MDRSETTRRERRRTDRALLAVVGVVWLWKAVEIGGRQAGLFRRNLGWGYVVDLSFPVAVTFAVALFFLVRRVASRKS